MPIDRQRQYFLDRTAYLRRLLGSAERRGDARAVRQLEQAINANSTLME